MCDNSLYATLLVPIHKRHDPHSAVLLDTWRLWLLQRPTVLASLHAILRLDFHLHAYQAPLAVAYNHNFDTVVRLIDAMQYSCL